MHLFCTYTNWMSLGYHVFSQVCDHKLVHIQRRTCTVCGKIQHKKTYLDKMDTSSYLDDMRAVSKQLNINQNKINFVER